jgi:hypothetical protein
MKYCRREQCEGLVAGLHCQLFKGSHGERPSQALYERMSSTEGAYFFLPQSIALRVSQRFSTECQRGYFRSCVLYRPQGGNTPACPLMPSATPAIKCASTAGERITDDEVEHQTGPSVSICLALHAHLAIQTCL